MELNSLKTKKMDEIKTIDEARKSLNTLLEFLGQKKEKFAHNEINECIEIVNKEETIYYSTSYIDYKGLKPEFKILKRRAKIQEMQKGIIDESETITGYKKLIYNLESSIIENHRESHIYTEKGVFIIHSDKNYKTLYGILKSPRNLEDLREKGIIHSPEPREKIDLGWKIKKNNNGA